MAYDVPPPLPNGYAVGPMAPDEYLACVDIAAEAFSSNNPAVRHLGLTAETYKLLTLLYAPREKCVGLSLVCREVSTGKPVAFLLMYPQSARPVILTKEVEVSDQTGNLKVPAAHNFALRSAPGTPHPLHVPFGPALSHRNPCST